MILDKRYPLKLFSHTELDNLLLQGDKDLVLITKKDNGQFYNDFNDNFKSQVEKLPFGNLKKTILDIYNRNKIYVLISSNKPETGIVSRVMMDSANSCVGIGLLNAELDINLKTGLSSSSHELIYGVYQGLIRCACISSKNELVKDTDLNKLLSTYFYLLILTSLGKIDIYNNKQKHFIHIVCLFMYYKHFIGMHNGIIRTLIKKSFTDDKLGDIYLEFEPRLDIVEKYSTIKDIAKVLIDTKIIIENPNSINMAFIKKLKLSGFYSIIGSLDLLICMAIISKYPSELYSKTNFSKIQDAIEQLFLKNYINNLKYSSLIL